MTLFLSAEVDEEVADALHQARARIKKTVVSKLADNYGPDVRTWALVTILRRRIPEGWGEVYKYHPNDRVAEFRLIIKFDEFRAASQLRQAQMVLDSILRSADVFPTFNVKDFDVTRFRRDVAEAGKGDGLIAGL